MKKSIFEHEIKIYDNKLRNILVWVRVDVKKKFEYNLILSKTFLEFLQKVYLGIPF